MFVSSERNQVLASKYHVESLVAPCKPSADSSLQAQSRCSAGRSVDTQGVIYLRLSPPLGPFLLGGGRHSDPSGAGLCLVHMWLSVGAPRSASRGPGRWPVQPTPHQTAPSLCNRPGASPAASWSSEEACREEKQADCCRKHSQTAPEGSIFHYPGSSPHDILPLHHQGGVRIPPLEPGQTFVSASTSKYGRSDPTG